MVIILSVKTGRIVVSRATNPGASSASLRDITSLNAATGLIQNMLKEGRNYETDGRRTV